jgi:adenine-specific DNA-methyltransferase
MPTLRWLNDEEARKTSSQIPYRLLEAEPKLSYGDSETENMLIQGDNLEALKALLPYYAGQVKCIYIDPPYNTHSAFEHYDDNLEHSTWLSMMYPRLEMLRQLLIEDGSIWVSIDDNEGHYLKVLMDEVFGRKNFLSTVIWQKKYAPKADSKYLSESHDFILAYAKHLDEFVINRIQKTEKQTSRYVNKDNDSRGAWKAGDTLRNEPRDYAIFPVKLPSGREVMPPAGTSWRYTKEKFQELIKDNRIWFGNDGNARPAIKRFLSEVTETMPATTLWTFDEVGHNDESKKESKLLFENDLFGTPKPERLIQRIIHLATNDQDLILDSFVGSGTTAAVAHKMGRRYIGIEMGDHAVTHCVPRLKKVIEGEQGGISKDVNWLGGGGFRFYQLGETIFDEQGHINAKVKFQSLAAHVWFSETHTPLLKTPKTPLLGIQGETAFYLLYNGILGDKTPEGGNVLTARVLRELPMHKGKKVIYGEMCLLDESTLQKEEITFKHIPYDIKAC